MKGGEFATGWTKKGTLYSIGCMLTHIRQWFSQPRKTGREDSGGVSVPGPVSKRFRIARGPLDHIAWPLIDSNNDQDVMLFNKYQRELTEHLGGYHNYFSICTIDGFLKSFNVALTPQTGPSYELLCKMHCVKFQDMPPRLYAKLPHLINHVISGGQIVHPLLTDQNVIEAE